MTTKTWMASTCLLALLACNQQPAETQKMEQMPEQEQANTPIHNQLSAQEVADGWVLLFDGETTAGWRGVYADSFPSKGWKVENGELTHVHAEGAESNHGGDIITTKQYSSFELSLEFNISEGGNSGIKYFVVERQPRPQGSAIGLEYQILDDERHPDAKKGRDGNRTIASLYDLIAADSTKKPNPPGSWNHARLVVNGMQVEHWLNGQKVLSYERGSQAFLDLVAISKYKDYENFGMAEAGHILLQDHGDQVSFRNIKIKELK